MAATRPSPIRPGLLDIHFVHEAMENALVRGFLSKLERTEIIPTVPPVPDTDLGDYFTLIDKRFSNPKIGDTIRRLCLDGSNRQPKFIIPTIADRLKTGGDVTGLALESALWCRYCFGTTDSGAVIEPNDPNWDRLVEISKKAKTDPFDVAGDGGYLRRGRQVAGLRRTLRPRARRAVEGRHGEDAAAVYRRQVVSGCQVSRSLPVMTPSRSRTPLCPAGHLPLKGGDQRRGRRAAFRQR